MMHVNAISGFSAHRFGRLSPFVAAAAVAALVTLSTATAEPGTGSSPDVRSYCTNIATAATDARFAWQTKKLGELETKIKSRVKDLDAKEAELRSWMEKRAALSKEAGEKLVGIYAKMRPETAATQIGTLDDDMAAAVLGQMNPRQASSIFNEIPAEHAAKLAAIIAGTAQADDKKL